MNEPTKILERLEEIGRSLAHTPHALALLGLGSAGQEVDRLDQYSDLDFFVLVEPGYQQQFLDDLSWLSDVAPVAYSFMNTKDGYKLLFQDNFFCEFAVFEPDQLQESTYAGGRIIWQAENAPEIDTHPKESAPANINSKEWLLGEALTNVYVGLGRERRGEKFSANRFIQGYAVDRIAELAIFLEEPEEGSRDMFDPARRFEKRNPALSTYLPQFMQGYNKNCESALAILNFLNYHFEIDQSIKAAILERIPD